MPRYLNVLGLRRSQRFPDHKSLDL